MIRLSAEQVHAWQLLREMGVDPVTAESFALRIQNAELLPRCEPAVRQEDGELFQRLMVAKRAEARATSERWANAS